MDQHILSRIDRAVADNLKDIQRSFGSQAGLVQDFIVFISRQLKTDLFGYTRFTLQQFCEHTGRSRQDLSLIHPDFAGGFKSPPVIQGYAFKTVLDYALYSMLERNIIFSSGYESKGAGSILQMQHFPILKDLKLNFGRRDNQQKVYDIRLSDELLSGFLSRYYIIDATSYRLAGKGRGGDSRKKLLIYLSKLRHVLQSTGAGSETTIPMDRLCRFADIADPKPSHKKQNLSRMLEFIAGTGKFPMDFDYVNPRGGAEYFVRLRFSAEPDKRRLGMEHVFYLRMDAGLRAVFESKRDKALLPIDEDPFQRWLYEPLLDTAQKAQVLQQAYYMAFGINVPEKAAIDMVLCGDFLRLSM